MRVIGGELGGRRYTPPTEKGLRPLTDRVRESLLNMLMHRLSLAGAHVLDCFSGGGSVAWECLSRGAASVTAVERNRRNAAFLRETAAQFGVADRFTVLNTTVETVLAKTEPGYRFIFLDPPYALATKADLIATVQQRCLLTDDGWLGMHHPSQEAYDHLPGFVEKRRYGGATLSLYQPAPALSPEPGNDPGTGLGNHSALT